MGSRMQMHGASPGL